MSAAPRELWSSRCLAWTRLLGGAVTVRGWLVVASLVTASCATPPGPKSALPNAAAIAEPRANGSADLGVALPRVEQPSSADIPITALDPVMGDPNASVTLVAFTDLECPFCARAHQTLSALRREYDGHTLRVVVKHSPLPFHSHAALAARMAQAVFELGGADRFAQYLDRVYAGQSTLSGEALAKWAGEVGLSPSQVSARAASQAVEDKVTADLNLAARLGATGTPNFRINGVELRGSQPIAAFRGVINGELLETKRLIEQGIPRVQVFARRVAANRVTSPADSADDEKPLDQTVSRIPVEGSPSRGPQDAPVTVVGFLDFECPYCIRAERTLHDLDARYPGKIRFVFKHNPLAFHKYARKAANFALEARLEKGEPGFWAAADLLWSAQGNLESWDWGAAASRLGLDTHKVELALSTDAHRKVVEADQELAADFEVRGAPIFFINGRFLEGAQPVEEFAKLVDLGLARAKELVEGGTPSKLVYAEIMKSADGPRYPEKKILPTTARLGPSRGPASAPVVVHLFSDFQCPYCERLTPTLESLEASFPNQIRLVFHQFPLAFHVHARKAAAAALEAFAQKSDAGFWAMHDLLFKHSGDPNGLAQPQLEEYAVDLGLDVARFRTALEKDTHNPTIESEIRMGQSLGVDGTPAVFINGYHISGVNSLIAYKRIVRHCLEELKVSRP